MSPGAAFPGFPWSSASPPLRNPHSPRASAGTIRSSLRPPQQRFVLRLPPEARNRPVVAVGIEASANPERALPRRIRCQFRPQCAFRTRFDQTQPKRRCGNPEGRLFALLKSGCWIAHAAGASLRPVITNRSCTPPSGIPSALPRNRASRTGPSGWVRKVTGVRVASGGIGEVLLAGDRDGRKGISQCFQTSRPRRLGQRVGHDGTEGEASDAASPRASFRW